MGEVVLCVRFSGGRSLGLVACRKEQRDGVGLDGRGGGDGSLADTGAAS